MYENIVAENNQLEESSFSHYTPLFRKCNEECNHRRGGLLFGELPMLAAWAGGFPPEEPEKE